VGRFQGRWRAGSAAQRRVLEPSSARGAVARNFEKLTK
jgi:hypothetical protein